MGGATISFINMLNGLIEKGIQPYVVIPRFEKRDATFMDYLDKNHIQFAEAFLTMSALHRPYDFLSCLKVLLSFFSMIIKKLISMVELLIIVKRVQPDIIHTNTGVIREGLYVAKMKQIPHIIHLREYQDKDFGWIFIPSKAFFRKVITNSTWIITITDGIREYFGLTDNAKVRTIYNGIYSLTNTHYESAKQRYFLCASRIIAEKGHEDVVSAFSSFYKSHPDYKLIIAGFGDQSFIEKLKSQAKNLHCLDAVSFVGYQKDVRPLMKQATALVVASYYEGFGRMTAEAWFNGCMVIGRNTAGTKEILDLTGGYRFNDVDELQECMNAVADLPPEEYKQVVLKGQSAVAKHFSNENNVEQIYALYTKANKESSHE